jgi:hypothetical protein
LLQNASATNNVRQGTITFFSKRGPAFAVGALAVAVTVIGVSSVHNLAGRPTMSFSKVAVSTSGEIEIQGYTKLGDGMCKDGPDGTGSTYDHVKYDYVVETVTVPKSVRMQTFAQNAPGEVKKEISATWS